MIDFGNKTTGRYYAISHRNRQICQSSARTCKVYSNTYRDIEDKMHFFFTCDLYDDLREILFQKILEAISHFVKILIPNKLTITFNDYYYKEVNNLCLMYISLEEAIYKIPPLIKKYAGVTNVPYTAGCEYTCIFKECESSQRDASQCE